MSTSILTPPLDLDAPCTAAELAAFLKVSEHSIRRQARAGKVPCIRIGASVRFIPRMVLPRIPAKRV